MASPPYLFLSELNTLMLLFWRPLLLSFQFTLINYSVYFLYHLRFFLPAEKCNYSTHFKRRIFSVFQQSRQVPFLKFLNLSFTRRYGNILILLMFSFDIFMTPVKNFQLVIYILFSLWWSSALQAVNQWILPYGIKHAESFLWDLTQTLINKLPPPPLGINPSFWYPLLPFNTSRFR